jgi:bifunctional DNase/RNase
MKENRIKLRIQGLTNSQIQSGAYALILAEDGLRRLPIIIGMFEAQSIAIALEGITPPRPLTHDLFIACMKATGFYLREVFIHKFKDGVFYSEILLTNGTDIIRIDSRTSDAISIALRVECDVYTTEAIMRKCGVVLEDGDSAATADDEPEPPLPEHLTPEDLQDTVRLKRQLRSLKKKDVEDRMAKAVAEENYEFAKIYKDELLRRENEDKNN